MLATNTPRKPSRRKSSGKQSSGIQSSSGGPPSGIQSSSGGPQSGIQSSGTNAEGIGIDNICIHDIISLSESDSLFEKITDILNVASIKKNTKKMYKFLRSLSKIDGDATSHLNIFNNIAEIVKNYKPKTNASVSVGSTPESGKKKEDDKNIKTFLQTLSIPSDNSEYIVSDIKRIINAYKVRDDITSTEDETVDPDIVNFQSKRFPVINKGKLDIFAKYQLWNKEDKRKFITIDPTIIQIMIFDEEYGNCKTGEIGKTVDIVYSLKLIIRKQNELYLRYTTQLFPKTGVLESKIGEFNDLNGFNNFNLSLGNIDIASKYESELKIFLQKYINYYEFYKKCYRIDDDNKIIEYQLKYISILGKARFKHPEIIYRTSFLTDYVMANLIFASPSYAFISGGYKGFKSKAYGITRSGYEMAKKYNRPILTIMCKEGEVDAHQFSDAKLIYGEHWGEDTIALSQLTDGAIIIAPFGGWTYVECLALLANKKIVGIYNDLYNILNYEKQLNDVELINKINESRKKYNDPVLNPGLEEDSIELNKLLEVEKKININKQKNTTFFEFAITEQNSIIDYYINYYIILYYIINHINFDLKKETQENFSCCLEYGIKILAYLKQLFKSEKIILENKIKINGGKTNVDLTEKFVLLIDTFNKLKDLINNYFNKNLDKINDIYDLICTDKTYQSKIPKKCDGIWIKPIFDLIASTITIDETVLTDIRAIETDAEAEKQALAITTGGKKVSKKYGGCTIEVAPSLTEILNKINFIPITSDNDILKNLSNNIIFVFSDVMYLNIYLNENLNTTTFQSKLQDKIKKLTTLLQKIIGSGEGDDTYKGSLRDLTQKEAQNLIRLERNIDGVYDRQRRGIIEQNIIRSKYNFIIDDTCNNYTALVCSIKENKVPPMLTRANQTRSRSRSKPGS
jgi:hypothetical protein